MISFVVFPVQLKLLFNSSIIGVFIVLGLVDLFLAAPAKSFISPKSVTCHSVISLVVLDFSLYVNRPVPRSIILDIVDDFCKLPQPRLAEICIVVFEVNRKLTSNSFNLPKAFTTLTSQSRVPTSASTRVIIFVVFFELCFRSTDIVCVTLLGFAACRPRGLFCRWTTVHKATSALPRQTEKYLMLRVVIHCTS